MAFQTQEHWVMVRPTSEMEAARIMMVIWDFFMPLLPAQI
jgi:hypothetical protein